MLWWRVLSHFSHVQFLQPYRLQPTRLRCPWDSPGKNTGAGCHAHFQGIFPTQEWNPHFLHLLHCMWALSCWAPGMPQGGERHLWSQLWSQTMGYNPTRSLTSGVTLRHSGTFSCLHFLTVKNGSQSVSLACENTQRRKWVWWVGQILVCGMFCTHISSDF